MKIKKLLCIWMVVLLVCCSLFQAKSYAQESNVEDKAMKVSVEGNSEEVSDGAFKDDQYTKLEDGTQENTEYSEKDTEEMIYGEYAYGELQDGSVTIKQYKGTEQDLIIPSQIAGRNVTAIGCSAFWNNSNLKSVTMPDSITEIGEDAFWGCNNLKNVKFSMNLSRIGGHAFLGASSLENADIPESVVHIGNSAFEDCSSLTRIKIPKHVKKIGDGVFNGCINLTKIKIPKRVKSIGGNAFSETKWLENEREKTPCVVVNHVLIDGQKCNGEVSILDGVEHIADFAFFECSSLTDVKIPGSVISIGAAAFAYCRNLASIEIADGVEQIGDNAFCDCTALTNINIPKTVTSIGDEAFCDCNSDLIVTVVKGSYAESYAKENNIKYSYAQSNQNTSSNQTWKGIFTQITARKNDIITNMDQMSIIQKNVFAILDNEQ